PSAAGSSPTGQPGQPFSVLPSRVPLYPNLITVIASRAKMRRSPCPRHGCGLPGRPHLHIQSCLGTIAVLDCFVATLLAMTVGDGSQTKPARPPQPPAD